MDISVVIPTMGRPAKIAACVRALARQTYRGRFQVLVGLDGPNDASALAAADAWRAAEGPADTLHVAPCPREGYNGVRNRLLKLATGRILVSLNDDVAPEPAFLQVHADEHDARRGQAVIVAGYSPWKRHAHESLLDLLVRETSMIFFYDQMLEHDGRPTRPADHDWGFRHCWGMNFSAPLPAVREVGGFTAFDLQYGYDDIELAHRLREHHRAPVLFRPAARAEHDHRYGAREILLRELRLGVSAWHFARERPKFCAELFGRDIRADDELAYSREFLLRERGAAAKLQPVFEHLESIPASDIAGPRLHDLAHLAYQQHLLLKRWMWRAGLVAAAEGRPISDIAWPA